MEYIEIPKRKSFVNLTGKRFGMITVLGYRGMGSYTHVWHVECDCGTRKDMIGTGLMQGATKSCGCLRKNNGGNTPMSKEQAESMFPDIKFVDYIGMKHPATIECVYCNKHHNLPLANALRGFTCDCRDGYVFTRRTEIFKEKGYTFNYADGQRYHIKCDICETNSVYYGALSDVDYCPCTHGTTVDEACAVYCLIDTTNNYIKVGKSRAPLQRLHTINSDRITRDLEPLELYDIIWVVSERTAYYVESLFHTQYEQHRLYMEGWTGSTETFSLNTTEFDNFKQTNKTLLDKLKTSEPEVIHYEHAIREYPNSIEIKGVWYPTKLSARQYLKVPQSRLIRYLKEEITYEEMLEEKETYEYRGVTYESITDIFNHYRISGDAVNKRRQKGYSLTDALDDVINNPLKVKISRVMVNGERMSVKDMWNKYGLNDKHANNAMIKYNRDITKVFEHFNVVTTDIIEFVIPEYARHAGLTCEPSGSSAQPTRPQGS